jgi:hypothetical protein
MKSEKFRDLEIRRHDMHSFLYLFLISFEHLPHSNISAPSRAGDKHESRIETITLRAVYENS